MTDRHTTNTTPATGQPAPASGRAAEAELYVVLRKAGEDRYEAQALIDRHRDEALGRAAEVRAERDALRKRVAELETFGRGCDAEGCVLPHSSWCERAQKHAAENDGCTCPKPWKGSPQPHAGYCWLLSPPRDEVERLTKANLEAANQAQQVIDELRARVAELEQQAAEKRAAALTEVEQHLRGLAVAHLDSGCDFCNGVDWAADKTAALGTATPGKSVNAAEGATR